MVLAQEVERLREELAQVYDLVSIGLTAEQLTHQIRDIVDRLNRSTKAAEAHARQNGQIDERLENFFISVRGAARGLTRELSHLDPALKYVREHREIINITDFVHDQKEYYDSRHTAGDISVKLDGPLNDWFSVWMNRGKLLQIVDNLMLNSEYWLKSDIKSSVLAKGIITLRIKSSLYFCFR